MLLPTTLPTARPGDPPSTACIVTANSGADVANDTTVRPTTSGLMPSARAMRLAPRTRISPPPISSRIPAASASACPMPERYGAARPEAG